MTTVKLSSCYSNDSKCLFTLISRNNFFYAKITFLHKTIEFLKSNLRNSTRQCHNVLLNVHMRWLVFSGEISLPSYCYYLNWMKRSIRQHFSRGHNKILFFSSPLTYYYSFFLCFFFICLMKITVRAERVSVMFIGSVMSARERQKEKEHEGLECFELWKKKKPKRHTENGQQK